MAKIQPDEIYNLGAQSHVKVSFDLSEYSAEVDGIGTLRLLNAIRTCGLEKKTRLYQASTSELYGKVQAIPQNEKTPFYPRSPYSVAKQFSYWIVVNYREAYGMFLSNGILFNHESPLLSLVRSLVLSSALSWACRTVSISETSTPFVTGVMPATTFMECG